MYLLMWLKKSWRGIKGIKYLCMALYSEMGWLPFVGSSLSSVPVKKQKHFHQLIAFAIILCRWWRSFSTLLSLIFFFFQSDGIFFERHLRHLFVIRFIKSIFTTMFTITGITSTVITFVVSFKKGQWWQKGIYSCPLKAISDASLCILCTAFLQKLYWRIFY